MFKTFAALLLVAYFASFASAQQKQVPNERFAIQISDIQPVRWMDYEPIQKNVYSCLDDKKLETPLCKKVQERLNYALYDALSQALVVNTLAKPGDPKFCEKYGQQLILDRKLGPAAMYALMLVDERMKYGSSLYGADLPKTYLGKIVHDSLLEASPCK